MNFTYKHLSIFSVLVVCLVFLFFYLQVFKERQFSENNVARAMDKGVAYLVSAQLPYGEWSMERCFDITAELCEFDSTPSVTAMVLYSLHETQQKALSHAIDTALTFLQQEEEEGGIWRYWSSYNPKHLELAPDLDDIFFISGVLDLYERNRTDNLYLLEAYRSEDGPVFTWFKEHQNNEIEPAVNANALFYLTLHNMHDSQICTFVNEKIIQTDLKPCEWCLTISDGSRNNMYLYYNASRAYKHGSDCLEKSKQEVITRVLAAQQEDGSFGSDFDTVLALNALMNFKYDGTEVTQGITYLVSRQKTNGSWSNDIIWKDPGSYYRSEAMVTALALESLSTYKNRASYTSAVPKLFEHDVSESPRVLQE